MRGHFDISLLDAAGKGDDAFEAAARAGSLSKLLASLKVEQRVRRDNLVNDNFASYAFIRLFSGGNIADPYDTQLSGVEAALATICLLTDAAVPSYTEESNWYGNYTSSVPNNVGGSAPGKRFIEDDTEDYQLVVDPDGREEMFFRSRFLWLPSQAISENIRSIGAYYSQDADYTSNVQRGIIARVQFKDEQDRAIVIRKTDRNVLLVEYTLFLTSV